MIAAGKTYEVLRTLARGGMGEVILAREQAGDLYERLVVLKTVLPHLAEDDAFVRAFLDEARIACQLQHPNIVLIFDVASLEGAPCIVMEWLRGRDLARIHRSLSSAGRPMPTEVAASIVLGAASALEHAHRATDFRGNPLEVVHRDVSPQNIVLTYAGAVKLIDFGIALSLHRSSKTATGVLKGKIGYMAPEQLSGHGADARSDLWALGVVAWECLTGRRLFASRREPDAAAKVLEGQIPPPSLARPEVDAELDAIVLGLLERDPASRIQTGGELVRRLTEWSRSHPLPAQPELAAWLAELLPEGDEGTDPGAGAGPTTTLRLLPLDGPDATLPLGGADGDEAGPDAPTELLTREHATRELGTRVAPTRVVHGSRARPAWLLPAAVAAIVGLAAMGALGAWLARRVTAGAEATPSAAATSPPAEAAEPAAGAPRPEAREEPASPVPVEPPEVERQPEAPSPRRTRPRRRRVAPRMERAPGGGLAEGIDSVYDLDRE